MKPIKVTINNKYEMSCKEINIQEKEGATYCDISDIDQIGLLQFLWQIYFYYESRSLEVMSYILEAEFNKEFSKLKRVLEVIKDFNNDLQEDSQ